MTNVLVIGPGDGEVIQPIQVRILEDVRSTEHRLGLGEIMLAPAPRAPAAPARGHDEGFHVVSGDVCDDPARAHQ